MKKLILGTSFTFTLFCIINLFYNNAFENDSILTSLLVALGMNFILYIIDIYFNNQYSNDRQQLIMIKSKLSIDKLSEKLVKKTGWKISMSSDKRVTLKTQWENLKSYGNVITISKVLESNDESLFSIDIKDTNPFMIYDFGNTKRLNQEISEIF